MLVWFLNDHQSLFGAHVFQPSSHVDEIKNYSKIMEKNISTGSARPLHSL